MSTEKKALKMLKEYRQTVNELLAEYFRQEKNKAKKSDLVAWQSVKSIEKFVLAGGKRLRPALLYYAYLASGRRSSLAVKRASLSIELIHSFLLIHDDIMDRDHKRHGQDTIHEKYRKLAQKYFPDKDHEHYGQSLAIVIGDLCYTLGNKILFQADFPAKTILKALTKLQDIVYEVIPGQIRDITLEFKNKVSEKEILRVQEAKTAHYTFAGPIQMGCILAGNKNKRMQENFTHYSLAVGKAFQIRDDILGIFGEEKKLGKPVGSDISEGKQTLLVNYVLKKGTPEQKRIINKLLGKKKISQTDLNIFRQIIKESGSLDYSLRKGEKLVKEALSALERIKFRNQQAKVFFSGIARYIIKREI